MDGEDNRECEMASGWFKRGNEFILGKNNISSTCKSDVKITRNICTSLATFYTENQAIGYGRYVEITIWKRDINFVIDHNGLRPLHKSTSK